MPHPGATDTTTAAGGAHDPSAPGAPGTRGTSVAGLRAVTFGYQPGVPIIRSVSAELAPGRVCALIGPNAAGKSTLLKLMLGQLDPWEGVVELDGQPVSALAPGERAALVSYVPQKGAVSFAFTVSQVVAMGRYALGDSAGAVDRALAVCDLTGLRHRVFAELSGGQQQRVLLARAVAQSAGAGRVMLLDEPASGMDLWHIHQTMSLLRTLAKGDSGESRESQGTGLPQEPGESGGPGGPGVLVVLHDVNLAARYADDVWLMDSGGLAAAGPWREVLQPKLLESVYGVRFEPMQPPKKYSSDRPGPKIPTAGTKPDKRPVFWIDPADTIE